MVAPTVLKVPRAAGFCWEILAASIESNQSLQTTTILEPMMVWGAHRDKEDDLSIFFNILDDDTVHALLKVTT